MEARSAQNHDNKIALQGSFSPTAANIMDLLHIIVIDKQYLFQRVSNCPGRDFAQKAKSRGSTLVTRAYIKESTYSRNIQSVYQKKSRFA